jgi:hypothetical protein
LCYHNLFGCEYDQQVFGTFVHIVTTITFTLNILLGFLLVLGFLKGFVLCFFLEQPRREIPDVSKRIFFSYALIIKCVAEGHRLESRLLLRKHVQQVDNGWRYDILRFEPLEEICDDK